jgi:DNA excision repair protein ERCC-8
MNFKMPGKVYGTAMSSLATSHTLIAAGTEDVQVHLCDIASGAFTHTLSGHRGMPTVHALIIPSFFFYFLICQMQG